MKKKVWNKGKKGFKGYWTGKKRPDYLGDKNPAKKIEVRKKISAKLTGRKFSKKWKKKLSDSHKGKPTWNKGLIGYHAGEKHHNWKGGLSFEPYTIDWTETLKRSIRERDHYVCFICKKLQGDITFSVHHIDYNKKNCNPNNLITLCESCHIKTNYNRDYWLDFFKKNE